MAEGSVTVTTAATLIIAANPGREELIIESDTALLWGISSSLVVTNGINLAANDLLTFSIDTRVYKGPVYGIVGSGTAHVHYVEILRQ
uniref:Uncharacterized protein n=1 Tax=viral metagenome TaxID=1070528 RepID=A0A6H1ZJ85_9ZZZZ